MHEFQDANWFKSTRCGGGPTCVEVAFLTRQVAVRDAKNPGPAFAVGPLGWRSFVGAITGEGPPASR
jgi:uncharacterized protein DUF397